MEMLPFYIEDLNQLQAMRAAQLATLGTAIQIARHNVKDGTHDDIFDGYFSELIEGDGGFGESEIMDSLQAIDDEAGLVIAFDGLLRSRNSKEEGGYVNHKEMLKFLEMYQAKLQASPIPEDFIEQLKRKNAPKETAHVTKDQPNDNALPF